MTRFYQPYFSGWHSNRCHNKEKHRDREKTKTSTRIRMTKRRQKERERKKKKPSRSLFTFGSHEVCIQFYSVFKFLPYHKNSCCDTCSRRRAKILKLFGKSCWRKMYGMVWWYKKEWKIKFRIKMELYNAKSKQLEG